MTDWMQNPHLDGGPFYWPGGSVGVLLIHGFTATSVEVRHLGQTLHEQGFTVAGPLLPGHFSRPEDLNRVSWRDWVRVCEAMYQELSGKCERVFVGGESTGGVLALYLAYDHPEVAGVLAYAPALRLNLTWRDVLSMHLAAPFVPYVEKKNVDRDSVWQGYTVNPLKGALQLLRLQRQTLPRLQHIRQPVLIVQGRLDPTVHPSVPAFIAQKVNSQLKEVHWMEQSRHCVLLDKELDQVREITLRFMRRALEKVEKIDSREGTHPS